MSVFLGCSCAPPSLSLIALGAGMLIDAVSSVAVLWRFEKDPATAPLSRQLSLRAPGGDGLPTAIELKEIRRHSFSGEVAEAVVASADEEDSASTAAASISAAENTLESSRHPLEAADAASTSERDSVATARVAAEGSSSRSLPPSHFSTDNAFIASESADAREEKATWCVGVLLLMMGIWILLHSSFSLYLHALAVAAADTPAAAAALRVSARDVAVKTLIVTCPCVLVFGALTAFKLFLSLQLKSSALFRDAVCSFFGAFLSLIALVASTSCLVFLQRPLEGNPKSLLPHNYDAIVGVAVSTLITLEVRFLRESLSSEEERTHTPSAAMAIRKPQTIAVAQALFEPRSETNGLKESGQGASRTKTRHVKIARMDSRLRECELIFSESPCLYGGEVQCFLAPGVHLVKAPAPVSGRRVAAVFLVRSNRRGLFSRGKRLGVSLLALGFAFLLQSRPEEYFGEEPRRTTREDVTCLYCLLRAVAPEGMDLFLSFAGVFSPALL
ncbi:transmembrane protein [Cyclospora cayetanensis]|uniref:Transmembrane protein n=1 Tax=Cyclospora cayetanensis TaxID=88456 RepID=A0A1D3D8J6_9EIME|nr:transmembrane protein [Cyclospora cayetanensis]